MVTKATELHQKHLSTPQTASTAQPSSLAKVAIPWLQKGLRELEPFEASMATAADWRDIKVNNGFSQGPSPAYRLDIQLLVGPYGMFRSVSSCVFVSAAGLTHPISLSARASVLCSDLDEANLDRAEDIMQELMNDESIKVCFLGLLEWSDMH